MTIRVLLADDQDLVRAGFAMVLGSQPDIEVAGEAVQQPEVVVGSSRGGAVAMNIGGGSR